MATQLPHPHDNQPYFTVTPIEAGTLSLSESLFLSNPEPGKASIVPSLSFLLRHSSSSIYALFDLGIRKNIESYPPVVQERIKAHFTPCLVEREVAESLPHIQPGLSPKDITHIFLSHMHWDHTGDHTEFVNAQFVAGGAGKSRIENGYPGNPDSGYLESSIPFDRTAWLTYEKWIPIGPFERAFDYLGDGSLYIVDVEGHMPGHINVLLRTSADGDWVYLAGDSAHDPRILTGKQKIGQFKDNDGHVHCMHEDKGKAEDVIRRIQELAKIPRVTVCLAHEPQWREKFKSK